MHQHFEQERNVGLHAANAEFLEAALHAADGVDETAAAGGDFDEHRIEERADDRAGEGGAGVEANAHAACGAVMDDAPIIGNEAVGGVFGGDAALKCEADDDDVGLASPRPISGSASFEPCGDEDLCFDDIDAGDFFGDGVFDLNPWIDFDEVILAGIAIDEELNGAGAFVVDRFADLDRAFAKGIADFGIEVRSRRDLDDFLMAALDGAIAFEEMNEVAMLVADQLDFDVTGALDEFFDEDIGAAERRHRFATGLVVRGGKVFGSLRRRACRGRHRLWRL